jgi:hypothetical protein
VHLLAVAVVRVPSRLPKTICAPPVSSRLTGARYEPGSGGRSGCSPASCRPPPRWSPSEAAAAGPQYCQTRRRHPWDGPRRPFAAPPAGPPAAEHVATPSAVASIGARTFRCARRSIGPPVAPGKPSRIFRRQPTVGRKTGGQGGQPRHSGTQTRAFDPGSTCMHLDLMSTSVRVS